MSRTSAAAGAAAGAVPLFRLSDFTSIMAPGRAAAHPQFADKFKACARSAEPPSWQGATRFSVACRGNSSGQLKRSKVCFMFHRGKGAPAMLLQGVRFDLPAVDQLLDVKNAFSHAIDALLDQLFLVRRHFVGYAGLSSGEKVITGRNADRICGGGAGSGQDDGGQGAARHECTKQSFGRPNNFA